MSDPNSIRVLNDLPFDGPTNMARDEALMTCVGTGISPPMLRLYEWNPPTVSLGYFQRYTDFEELPPPAGALAVVRRLTGGGAILHDLELTYSLTLPIHHPLLVHGPTRLYGLVHEGVIAALKELGTTAEICGQSDDSGAARGPFFCFARRHACDVLLRQEKIAGSAQRRTRSAVLQHGSIVLDSRFHQQPTARLAEVSKTSTEGIEKSTPFKKRIAQLRALLVDHLSRLTGMDFPYGAWSESELEKSRDLTAKYAGEEWTKRL